MNADFHDKTVLTRKAQDLKRQGCGYGLFIWSITRFTRLCCYFLFLLCLQIDSIENRHTAAKIPGKKCNSNIKRKWGKSPKCSKVLKLL